MELAQKDQLLEICPVARLGRGWPVGLWPIGVEAVERLPPGALEATADAGDIAAVLRLRLACLGNRQLAEFRPPMLRFFLHGPRGSGTGLYELLIHRLRSVMVADPETGRVLRVLPPGSVRQVGFDSDEALLPQPAHAHEGHRLLQEYFAFPEKFLFVDVAGLGDGPGLGVGRTVDLLFLLDAAPDDDLVVDRDSMRLGCTPMVNLFRRVSERPGRAFWSARGEPAVLPDAPARDVHLPFVDQALAPARPPAEALFANLLCTNRGLAEQIPAGARLQTEIDAPVAAVICLTRPTPQQPPVMGGAHLWHLVSQLSLNHLSLSGAEGLEALKEILRLHGGTRGEDAGSQIAGLTGLDARRIVRRIGTDAWRGLCRGIEITLRVDEDRFVGASPWLLGAVLSRFLALHAAASSFTQLVVESRRRGRTSWPPQAGAAPVV